MEQKPNVLPLRIEDVSYQYEPDARPAVSHVTLEVERGSFVAVLGHNGSGKSTLAKLMNALFLPTEGRVLVCGMDTLTEERVWNIRRHAGMVFQNPDNQIVANVVEEDVAFAPENLGVPSEEIRRRVDDALTAVGMEKFTRHAPHLLSGGQKQRVAIAGVIAMEPDVLILDEPTAGLDPRGRESILQNIRDYQAAQHAAVVMVSHSMEEIASNVDRLLVMNHGQNVMNGTPAEVFSHAEELVEMGLAIPKMTQLFLALKRRGVPVDTSVFSVEQARQALRPLLKGGRGVC